MDVTVDEEKCCGAGQCALRAPEVFAQREDRIVMLLQPTPDDLHRDAVIDAVDSCPMGAITLSGYTPVPAGQPVAQPFTQPAGQSVGRPPGGTFA